MRIAETLNIPARRFEMQVLYGMGDKLSQALVKRGHRVRVYSPYGNLLPGMAYLIRRLLENTANSSFIKQNQSEKPIEELIAPPVVNENGRGVSRNAPTGLQYAPDTDYADTAKRIKAEKALQQVKQFSWVKPIYL